MSKHPLELMESYNIFQKLTPLTKSHTNMSNQ